MKNKIKELFNLLFFGGMFIIVIGCTYTLYFETKTSWVILPIGFACLCLMGYGVKHSLKNFLEL